VLRKILPIFLLFIHQSSLFSADNWTKISTPHFEIDTQLNSHDAMRALEMFEQTRGVFEHIGFAHSLPDQPLRVIDLGSDGEYSRFLVKPGAYGCYQRGRRGDYIILRDLNPAHDPVAVHEYTHFVVEHSGLKLPIWLNEGMAELYSTMELRSGQCLIGRPHAGRLAALATYRRLPLDVVFSVDAASHYYNDPSAMQIFYAESWALTHMLALGNGYAPHFSSFVQAISAGDSAEAALRSCYGKSLQRIEADLDAYLRQQSFPTVSYQMDLQLLAVEPVIGSVRKSELDLSAADLLASNAGAGREALDEVRELARRHPHDPGFEETLGYVALRDHQADEARAHFATAVENQSDDPVTIYNSARLEQAAGAGPEQLIPLLQRVLALKPDYEPARVDLGFAATRANQFELALAAFSQLKTLNPKMGYEVLYTMAYCAVQLHRPAEASVYAAQAQQQARNDQQRNRADALRRFIDRQQMASLRQ
jgi:Flp pilus assembly protein TadD